MTDSVPFNSIGKRYICGTTDNFIGNIADVKIYSNQNFISSTPYLINSNTNSNTIISNSISLFEYAVIIVLTFLSASGLGMFMYKRKKKLPTESNASLNQSIGETNIIQELNRNQIQDIKLCKNCGQIIYPGEFFCANCGKRL